MQREKPFLSEADTKRMEETRRAEEDRKQERCYERKAVRKVKRRDLSFLTESETKRRLEEIRRAEEAREQESSNVNAKKDQ